MVKQTRTSRDVGMLQQVKIVLCVELSCMSCVEIYLAFSGLGLVTE